MADSHNLIVAVLVKYALRQPLSDEETRLLEEWQSRSDQHRVLPEQLRDPQWHEEHRRELQEAPSDAMWENIRRHVRESKENEQRAYPLRKWPSPNKWRYSIGRGGIIAASLILVSSGGVWLYRTARTKPNIVTQTKSKPPVTPLVIRTDDTSNLLTLNGETVNLDKSGTGDTVGKGKNVVVTKINNGIVYDRTPENSDSRLPSAEETKADEILSIGRRRTTRPFQVVFADGSRAFVDTMTRMSYAADLWSDPNIHMDGEARFDINRNGWHQPLRVWGVNDDHVTVLATSFDFLSRTGHSRSKTELYTGKVQVKRNADSVILRPQSMVVITEGKRPEISKLQAGQDMPAWIRPPATSPYFEFQNTPLSVALGEVAQWYVMTVSNPHNIKGIPITGKLPHSESLDNTLRALERVQNGHAFLRRKGDTIVVLPGDAGP